MSAPAPREDTDLVVCPACDGEGWSKAPDQPCELGCIRLYETTLISGGYIADHEGPTVVLKGEAKLWTKWANSQNPRDFRSWVVGRKV